MTGTTFSPANQLLHEVKLLGAEIHQGTPAWAQFPRWYRVGGTMWLESSAGSRMLTVNFNTGLVTIPEWAGGGTQDMPDSWHALYLGSLFNPDGSALHPMLFDAAMAQDGWKAAHR